MHKKTHPDKKTGARNRRMRGLRLRPDRSRQSALPKSVSELMGRRPKLSQFNEIAATQRSWAEWLCARLPPELSGHIISVVVGVGELVVFADSAAWCTRVRYALAALESEIRAKDPSLQRARARVQMRL
jgi:Dna[CI] antecedent, DciA